MKRKYWIFVLLVFAFVLQAPAQERVRKRAKKKGRTEWKDRKWRFYGGFGLGLSNSTFTVQLYPGVMYRIRPDWYAGGGLYYAYYSSWAFGTSSKAHVYGGSLLTAWSPWRYMETSLEYQYLFMTRYYGDEVYRRESPALYLGVGYRMPHVVIGIRYDLLYKEGRSFHYEPFSPFVRIYF
ncbi:MAG: alpha-ketoglutarate decarboxylase [Chlorobi bacterium]|nr:alpha-ketoglutarate decarboxylase [Chlorobiota bacterium]